MVVGCGAGLVACGSSAKPSSPASAAGSSAIRFSECMRSHGVANFPDPGASGGIQITPSSGINPQSPAFRSAQTACQKLLPGGGPGKGPVSEARKHQLVLLAACMRAHGLTSFPDPTNSPPSSPPANGFAFGGPGGFLSIPGSLIQSPAFKGAAQACGLPGFGNGSGPRP